jgi:hypothetical protein
MAYMPIMDRDAEIPAGAVVVVMCSDVDRCGFAMVGRSRDGHVVLTATLT